MLGAAALAWLGACRVPVPAAVPASAPVRDPFADIPYATAPLPSHAKVFLVAGGDDVGNFAAEVVEQRELWKQAGLRDDEIACYYAKPTSKALADDGPQALTTWLAANGVPADSILDVGRAPNATMGQVVRDADVALFPNRCEGGTNLVAMECMAAGVPTIVSNNTGHRDLVATGGCFALATQRPVRPPTRFYRGVDGWGESDVEEMVEQLERVQALDRDLSELGARNDVGGPQGFTMSWEYLLTTARVG